MTAHGSRKRRYVHGADASKIFVDRMIAEDDRVIGIIRMPDHKTGESIVLVEAVSSTFA